LQELRLSSTKCLTPLLALAQSKNALLAHLPSPNPKMPHNILLNLDIPPLQLLGLVDFGLHTLEAYNRQEAMATISMGSSPPFHDTRDG